MMGHLGFHELLDATSVNDRHACVNWPDMSHYWQKNHAGLYEIIYLKANLLV